MSKNEIKKRILFTKAVKRHALLELAKGSSLDEICEIIFTKNELKFIDKSHVSKLLFKWRNAMYKNKEVLNYIKHNLDDKNLKYEIENFNFDCDEDEIKNFIEMQMKNNL